MDTSIPRRSTVADVMSRHNFCVRSTTSLREVVDLMATYDLGALPVIDSEGLPVGVVSATDLLPREQAVMPLPRHTWAVGGPRLDHEGGRIATRAGDIMSTPALTIPVEAPVAFAARRLQEGGVRQLVVIDGQGRVRGMVSRADLLRVFARSDTEIRRDIVDGVIARWLRLDPSGIDVSVHEGSVVLSGRLDSAADQRVLLQLTGGVEGVLDVASALTIESDDMAAAGRTPG
jgi:CBS domain-containing protein